MKIKLFIILLLALPLISAELGFINPNIPKLQNNKIPSVCVCSYNASAINESFVPYTGALNNVDLGSQTLTTSQQVIANAFQDYSTGDFFSYDGTDWLFQNPINVNGDIKQNNIDVCLNNGTNCGSLASYQFTSNNFNGSGNFTTSGYVGIGTTTPSQKLEVGVGASGMFKISGDTYATKMDVITEGGVYWGFGTVANPESMFVLSSSGGANNINTVGRDFKFYSTDIPKTTSIMTLKRDSGNVGIGTINPTDKLNVIGNVNITGNITGTQLKTNGFQINDNMNGSGNITNFGIVTINSSNLIGSLIVTNATAKHFIVNGSNGRIHMLGVVFSSVSGSTTSGTAMLGSSSPTITTPRIASIFGGTGTTSNLTLQPTTANGTATGGNIFFQTNATLTTLNMIISNRGSVNITRGNLTVNGTINTNTNFSVSGISGITRNINLMNITNSSCFMNYTGGILTWSDC